MTALELDANGYKFSAEVTGPSDGELVLLLHGFPQSAAEWSGVMPFLADAGYAVVAPDQRGYAAGARPSELDAYRLEHLVSDALGFADDLGVDQFHLVGHDWGGMIAWQVAGRHPERLLSLSVVSTPHPVAFRKALGGADQQRRSAYMEFFRSPESTDVLLADDAALLRSMFERSGLESGFEPYITKMQEPGALDAALNWYRAVDTTGPDGLGPIMERTLYVWSDDDIALGEEAARATGDHVYGEYTFAELTEVSHWIPDRAPNVLAALLLQHFPTV
ncbi:MAG: alpha/beta hydrolase [Actinomycetia bacterium]|nr:alpha/beta hydrolase [Actinomycetes bacterium]